MTSCFVAGGVTRQAHEDLDGSATSSTTIIREIGHFVIQEYVPIVLALGRPVPGLRQPATTRSDSSTAHDRARLRLWLRRRPRQLPRVGRVPEIDGDAPAPTRAALRERHLQDVTARGPEQLHRRQQGRGLRQVPRAAAAISFRLNLHRGHRALPLRRSRRSTTPATATSPSTAQHALSGRRLPHRSRRADDGYTYMKAPRWSGNAMEVGPLARWSSTGHYPVDGTHARRRYVPGYTGHRTSTAARRSTSRVLADHDSSTARSSHSGPRRLSAYRRAALHRCIAVHHEPGLIAIKGGLSTMDRLRARALESSSSSSG